MKLTDHLKAALYAAFVGLLFVAVDWTRRLPYTFPDLDNYREGFQSGWYLFSTLNLGWIEFILNEGGWVFGFDALWRQVGDIYVSFMIVSAIATCLICYFITLRTRSFAALLFIFNPAFIHLMIEQLRSGLATGIFYCATLIRRPYLQLPLFVLAISIHTAFLIFVGFYYSYRLSDRIRWLDRPKANIWLSMLALFIVGYFISLFRETALNAIGDERALIFDDQTSGIMLGIAWIMFLGSFSFLRKRGRNYGFELYFFMFNVGLFLASLIIGSYGARFVAIGIPALAVMSRDTRDDVRWVFYLHYFAFSMLYMAVWLRT